MSGTNAITESNFKSDLSKVVSKDKLRPSMTVVRFQDGYAYATDAHCLIRQSLSWMGFTEGEISMLNGKSLDMEAFKFVRASKLIQVHETHISCFRNGTKFNVEYSIHPANKFPEYEAVIPKGEPSEIGKISFTKKNMINLLSAMFFEKNPIFEFYGQHKAVVVYDEQIPKYNQIAIIMPCMINN